MASYTKVPTYQPDHKIWLGQISAAVNTLRDGKINSTGVVTLAASASSTAVNDPRCGGDSLIFLMPMTANAAAVVASTYILQANIGKEQFTVTHPNNANTDKTFAYVILG